MSGYTLVEVLIALVLLAVGLLAAVPLFSQAMHGNAAGGAIGSVAAAAEERFELLRSEYYKRILPGGSLTSDVTGYFDTPQPGVVVRWQVTNNGTPVNTKIIAVRAIHVSNGSAPAHEVNLVTLRGY